MAEGDFAKKWFDRWNEWVDKNDDVKSIRDHRKLINDEELFRLQMVDGTYEVRHYAKRFKKTGYKIIESGNSTSSRVSYREFRNKLIDDGIISKGNVGLAGGDTRSEAVQKKKSSKPSKPSKPKKLPSKKSGKKKSKSKKREPITAEPTTLVD